MAQIGRNDPCSCGSGKKYKKCCLGKSEKPNKLQKMLQAARPATPAITAKPVRTRPPDQPGRMNDAELDEMMRRGFALTQSGRAVEGCRIWLEVWDQLKKRFTPEMKDVEAANVVFRGAEFVSNFCQDLEMELGNAGTRDKEFYRKRIEYCSDFCRLFAQTDPVNLNNMKRAIGESYFALGMDEEGEKAFEALVREFPDDPWSYIGWGDAYLWPRPGTAPDYDKAERIYRLALGRNLIFDRDEVEKRLEDVKEARGTL